MRKYGGSTVAHVDHSCVNLWESFETLCTPCVNSSGTLGIRFSVNFFLSSFCFFINVCCCCCCRVSEPRLWEHFGYSLQRSEQHHMGTRHRLHIHRWSLPEGAIPADLHLWACLGQYALLPRESDQELLRLACTSLPDISDPRQFLLLHLSA